MSKHTPGPWILLTVPTSVGSCHKIGPFQNGSRGATYACIYADGNRKGIDDENPSALELYANARLISAAPELLAVVQDLEESACYWSEYEVPLGIVDRLRAAIDKATGGKS